MSKIFGYLAAFLGGLLAFLAFSKKKEDKIIDPHFKDATKPLEEDIKQLDEHLKKIEESGVEDKTLEEEKKYWEKN